MCGLCQSRGQTCTYDAEAGLTRIEALRRRNKELAEQNANYTTIFNALRSSSEPEAIEHLRRLRASSDDAESYAEMIRQGRQLAKRRKSVALKIDTDDSYSISQESAKDLTMNTSLPTEDSTVDTESLGSTFGENSQQLDLPITQRQQLDGTPLQMPQRGMSSTYERSIPSNL